ncbi:YCF48-related protein [Bacteroidota bacterium]
MDYKLLFQLILLNFFMYTSLIAQSGWVVQNSGVNEHMTSISFANINTGWCTSLSGKILKTTNGGNNWFIQENNGTDSYWSIKAIDANTAFAAGNYHTSLGMAKIILRTINGGNSWQLVFSAEGGVFLSMSFINANTGWVSSDASFVCKTTNMGANWEVYGTNQSCPSVFFTDYNNGYTCGGNGLSKTTNGGTNWFPLSYSNIQNLFFINKDTGWISGEGFINRTKDGGYNWFPQIMNDDTLRMGIYFTSKDIGYVVGEHSVIQKTTNGGLNWIYQTGPGGRNFHDVHFQNQYTGWIVGNYGVILKTTTGGNPTGIKPITSVVVGEYSLSQNYPNPFNPTTTIKFDIQKTSATKLVVYDALGREIATLVNEELKAGSYEVNWNGSNYTSGVYFYTLQAGDYKETKKMLLLK